jgi:serine protease Do
MKRALLVLACLSLGAFGTYIAHSLVQGQVTAVPVSPKELTSYRDIVKKVLPAVVSIEAQARGSRLRRTRPEDMQLPEELDRHFGAPGRKIDDQDEFSRVGFGSGFLVNSRGVVVTNNHVVAEADRAMVQLRDGRKFYSRDIKTDPKTDLAIIRLDVKIALPHLEFGDSEQMEIGDRVLAVGAPFGLAGTVTHGIISAKGRALKMNMYEDFLQTDAAINPGNSGGPLINLEGKVIGINSAIKSRTGGFQGIGLAISSNLGKAIMQQLLKSGVVRRGYLGVGIRDVDEEVARELKLKEARGVQITRLLADGPGKKAGVKVDDVIVRVNGKAVRDGRELQTVVAGLPLGKAVKLEVIRDGKPKTLEIVVQEQPKTFGSMPTPAVPEPGKGAFVVDKVGMVVADLSPDLAESLGYSETAKGALITRIDRRGLAGNAGLLPGMLVTSVNGKKVTGAKGLLQAMRSANLQKGARLTVTTPRGGSRTVTLRESDD